MDERFDWFKMIITMLSIKKISKDDDDRVMGFTDVGWLWRGYPENPEVKMIIE